MKRLAQVDTNHVVINIIVANDDWNVQGFIEYTDEKPAGIGYTYRADIDAFVPPKPFSSWILNNTAQWEPPTPMPTDGGVYSWDKTTTSWVEA